LAYSYWWLVLFFTERRAGNMDNGIIQVYAANGEDYRYDTLNHKWYKWSCITDTREIPGDVIDKVIDEAIRLKQETHD
jgi:hypothetical protein